MYGRRESDRSHRCITPPMSAIQLRNAFHQHKKHIFLPHSGLAPQLFVNTREEWFSDPQGVRNETPGTYSEATLGLNVMPVA
jgi:hypothetical protein